MLNRKKTISQGKLQEFDEKKQRLSAVTEQLIFEALGRKSASQFDQARVKQMYNNCLSFFKQTMQSVDNASEEDVEGKNVQV